MSYQTKRKLMNGLIYATLILTVVTVAVVTVVTLTTNTNHPVTPVESVEPTPSLQPEKSPTPVKPKPTAKPKEETPQPEPTTPCEPTPTVPSNHPEPLIFTLPVEGSIMKEFSTELPVFSLTMGDWRTHSGIDISVAAGEGVSAVAHGTVKSIKNLPMMGLTIEIDHGNGLVSRYSNLSTEMVAGIIEGVSVGGGQLIASVGSSALSEIAEADHLHFEMELNGVPVDPTVYLDFSSQSTDGTEID